MDFSDAFHLLRELTLAGLYHQPKEGWAPPTYRLVFEAIDSKSKFWVVTPNAISGLFDAHDRTLTIPMDHTQGPALELILKSDRTWKWHDREDLYADYIDVADHILAEYLGERDGR